MTKHIGIVACSAEGAALCYRTICAEGPALMGRHAHPEVSMHTHPLSAYMRTGRAGWAELMLSSTEKLARVGADFVVCPDNTLHQAFELVMERSPLPWLHIAGEVAAEAERRGFRRPGLLGTRYLMEGPVYSLLRSRGIEYLTPGADDRKRVSGIIFDELVNARFLEKSRGYFKRLIAGFKRQGCDAVILGCTEIPLLVSPEDSPLPVLDSTRLLARAALRLATGSKPEPTLHQPKTGKKAAPRRPVPSRA